MKNKIKLSRILLVALLNLCLINVKALNTFPNTTGVVTHNGYIGLNTDLEVSTAYSNDYAHFNEKTSPDGGDIICTSGLSIQSPVGYSCTLASNIWDLPTQKKIAYVINTVSGIDGGVSDMSPTQYYWTELLINQLLGTYTIASHPMMNQNVGTSSSYNIAGTGMSWQTIINNANSYSNISASISATATNLTFTKNSDGYYYSNAVSVTSSTPVVVSLSNDKFSYKKTGDSYIFYIKSDKLNLGDSQSLTVTFNTSLPYYVAGTYICGNNGVDSSGTQLQRMTISRTKSETSTDTKSLIGTVTKSLAEIKVAKVNEDQDFIAGARLMLQNETQKNSNSDGTIKTSNSENYVSIGSLVAGKYYLSEKEAPVGYDKTDEVLEIIIDNEGKIKVNGEDSEDATLKVVNALTQTHIKKTDATGKELPGATLQVLGSNGQPILDADGNELYKWISTENEFIIEGLPVGKYYLKEIIAPEGYILNEKSVEFRVKGDGTVTKVEMINVLEVDVPDTLSPRSTLLLTIAMLDIALGIGILTYVKKNKFEQ